MSGYEEYLLSDLWQWNKDEAGKKLGWGCLLCKSKHVEWHHVRGYEAIWTENDWKFIVPLCHEHHMKAHYVWWFGRRRLPRTRRALTRRFIRIHPRWIMRLRPSDLFFIFT